MLRLCLIFIIFTLNNITKSHANSQLIATDDDVVVYSGPSFKYRPLYLLKNEQSLESSDQAIKTSDAYYYKVIVIMPDQRRIIGYVPSDSPIRVRKDSIDEEDFSKYSELSLSKHSISMAFSYLKSDEYMVHLGWQNYLTPGFYIKYYGSEYMTQKSSGHHLGVEFGNDALLSNKLSAFVSYGGGIFMPNANDAIFIGSQTKSLNFLLRGAAGLRLNQSQNISFSIGPTQLVIFNANNSLVSFGAQLSLEVGI